MSAQARFFTLSDVAFPTRAARISWVREVLLIVGGSLLVALSAQVAVPLPWTPVPITGQTFGVLLIGFLLGARRGALCLALYLTEGTLGLPFFAQGGSGLNWLRGATAGYLVGFIAAAALTGYLAERGWDRRFDRTFAAMLLGNGVIYAFGLPWLAQFVGWDQVWVAGLAPFLPGDLLKVLLAVALLPSVWRRVGNPGQNQESPPAPRP